MLMFEGTLRFLATAESALSAGELERFATALARAEAVIAELLHTLDSNAGGEIAKTLDIIANAYREALTRQAHAA